MAKLIDSRLAFSLWIASRRGATIVAVMTLLTAAASRAATPSEVAGLWGWHPPWQSAPADVVKELGPRSSAPGVLINFCPNGRLRIATGVLYRSVGSSILGSSDGIALYEGQWSSSGEVITVSYRLADSELQFEDTAAALHTPQVEHPHIVDGALLFKFRHFGGTSSTTLRFRRATIRSDVLDDRFVECSATLRK